MSRSSKPTTPPSISDSEWVVMQVLWHREVATANQVVEDLESKMHWKPKTIHTLIRRLVQKNAVAFEKVGREFHFRPQFQAAECLREASRSFLDRFFGGRVAPFLSSFLEQEHLTHKEIEELRRILDRKER